MAHAPNSEALIQTALDTRAKLRLLQDAILTDDLHQIAEDSRKLVYAYQAPLAGLSPPAEIHAETDDAMGTHFHIGDAVTHQQSPAPVSPPAKSGWLDTLLKAGLLAGALGTGLSLPAAIWTLGPLLLRDRSPPVVERPIPAITSSARPGTAYDLEFVH